MPSIRQVYLDACAPQYGLEEMTIRMLLVRVNGLPSMTELFTHMDDEMRGLSEFQRLFARVLSGEPVQYVLREASFYGLTLFVDSRVLIPRPETEELVEKIIIEEKANRLKPLVIADVGTGSGCIALALEEHFPKASIFGIDTFDEALEVAEINKAKHKSSITLMKGNLLNPLLEKGILLDILVSNPPYIENPIEVDSNVIGYEPHSALFAPNGIDHYVAMILRLPFIMKDGGRVYFEINHDQEDALTETLKKHLPSSEYRFLKDMQKKTRYLFIIYRKEIRENED